MSTQTVRQRVHQSVKHSLASSWGELSLFLRAFRTSTAHLARWLTQRQLVIGGFRRFLACHRSAQGESIIALKALETTPHGNKSQKQEWVWLLAFGDFFFAVVLLREAFCSVLSVLTLAFPYRDLQLSCTLFQELRSEIELEVYGDTEELQMSFTAICPNGTVLPDLKRCSNVKPGETVSGLYSKWPFHASWCNVVH